MSDIDDKVLVRAPLGSAGRFLERYFTAHAAPNGRVRASNYAPATSRARPSSRCRPRIAAAT